MKEFGVKLFRLAKGKLLVFEEFLGYIEGSRRKK